MSADPKRQAYTNNKYERPFESAMLETDATVWTRGKKVYVELPASVARKLHAKNHEQVHITLEHAGAERRSVVDRREARSLHSALSELYSHKH